MSMKILHMTLKKKWFDMIASGEKKEEYRECKEYWWRRFVRGNYHDFIQFDIIRFTNGYAKDAPRISVKWEGITIRRGCPEWGAVEGEQYFVIKLGEIINQEPAA